MFAGLIAGWLVAAHVFGQAEGTGRWATPFLLSGLPKWSSPAIGPDGTIYIAASTSSTPSEGLVWAITPTGNLKWPTGVFEVVTGKPEDTAVENSVTVDADGNVYFGSFNGRFYAVSGSTGKKLWDLLVDGTIPFVSSSAAIGADGTIYFGSGDFEPDPELNGSSLYAVTPQGQLRWPPKRVGSPIDTAPAIARDGTIYFGTEEGRVYAINADGSEKWSLALNEPIYSTGLAIGSDGTIYVGTVSRFLYAIRPDGTVKWKFETDGSGVIIAAPAIGPDGTIYFGTASEWVFYAITPGEDHATVKWKYDVAADIPAGSKIAGTIESTAAVRADGTVIFGACNGRVYALNAADGSRRWAPFQIGDPNFPDFIFSSPAIAPDGTIYIGSNDGGLYAINGNGSPLSTTSSWPMFQHDVAHQGRTEFPLPSGGRLINLSTRGPAGGDAHLIVGFVISGNTSKYYLLRGVGPGLDQFGVPDTLADPTLTIFDAAGRQRVSNDDWGDSAVGPTLTTDVFSSFGAFPLPEGSRDSAIAALLEPGIYTAQVNGAGAESGAALVEVYDGVAASGTELLNLSTRGTVQPGGSLFGGVVTRGGPLRLLVRAVGPALAQFPGVGGTLQRPLMIVRDSRTGAEIARNSGWSAGHVEGDLTAAMNAVGAFTLPVNSSDAAAVIDVPAGEYTVQVSGADGGSGEALVEIYVLR